MDDTVVGMQMNLFMWAKQNAEDQKKRQAVIIDAVDVFEYRKGVAIGLRFLREEAGEELKNSSGPVCLNAWREKA